MKLQDNWIFQHPLKFSFGLVTSSFVIGTGITVYKHVPITLRDCTVVFFVLYPLHLGTVWFIYGPFAQWSGKLIDKLFDFLGDKITKTYLNMKVRFAKK